MKCPHCLVEFAPHLKETELGIDREGHWRIVTYQCSSGNCGKFIFYLLHLKAAKDGMAGIRLTGERESRLIHPKTPARTALPPEVPQEYTADYIEACLVLADSPKASAALSRRCLQHLLREVEKVNPGNLVNEIQEVIDRGKLPSHLIESIDAIRNIGNFSAHPIKSTSTGEIVSVEPGEAEWNLDVLESLFDFYFVQPEILRKKREALNKKLKDAGKPEMK